MSPMSRTALVLAMTTAVTFVPRPSLAAPPTALADVWIDSWGGPWATLCGHGDVNDGATTLGRWVFTVTGAVVEPYPVGPYVQIDDGDTFDLCESFYVGSPPDAAFTVTLTFTGANTVSPSSTPSNDAAGGAVLVYEWNSAFGDDNQFQVGTNG